MVHGWSCFEEEEEQHCAPGDDIEAIDCNAESSRGDEKLPERMEAMEDSF
jgi:hypothetical protein